MEPDESSTGFVLYTEADEPSSERHREARRDPLDEASKQAGTVSATALTINLVNASLGSGILSIPWAMEGASIVVGVALTLVVLFLNFATNMILVVAADRWGAFDLGNLLGKLPGAWARPARALCDITIWLSVGICLIGYFIVLADSLSTFLPQWGVAPGYARLVSIAIGIVIVTPLCFVDQNRLAFASTLGIAVNIYLLLIVLVTFTSMEETKAGNCLLGNGPGIITMSSALMQAFIFQMCILPMYESLERRSPQRFAACLFISFVFVFILFVSFSVMAVQVYGISVSSNILTNLPDNTAGSVARLGFGLSVLGVYPIYLNSMVAPLQHTEQRAAERRDVFMFPSPKDNMPGSPWASPQSSRGFYEGAMLTPPSSGERRLDMGALSDAVAAQTQQSRWRNIGLRRLRVKLAGWRTHLPAKPSHLATLLIILASALGATRIADLGFCNIINGAGTTATLIGWAPGLTGIFLGPWKGTAWRLLMVLLIVFSTMMSGVGLVYTDNGLSQLRCAWKLS